MSQKRTKPEKNTDIADKREPKVDNSPKIYQGEKIKQPLKIRELPWTERQQAILTLGADKDTRILFLAGPAGASKTTLAMRIALQLLNEKKVSSLVLVRAAVESAESKLGALPGDIDEKIAAYMGPFHDKLEELLFKEDLKFLVMGEHVEYKPINFCRGASWTAKCVVIDEAQNLTISEIQTLMTRMGKYSKMVICADESQSDLPYYKRGGFSAAKKLFSTDAAQDMGIFSVELTNEDIVRSELCKFIVMSFDEFKKQHEEPEKERGQKS